MNAQLVNVLTGLAGASFASFDYTAKGTGEKAKVQLILGSSIENQYEKDVKILKRYVSFLKVIGAQPHVQLAAQEMLVSKLESLEKGVGNNSAYTNADTYTHLNHLPGVKIHNETGELYITAMIERKTVITPGVYKTVKSAPKTIVKKKITKHLPSSRFRTYKLDNITGARVRGEVLEFDTA